MSHAAPLEMLADASGSVTFGWAGDGVYYARFSRCLSARLGEAFAGRLRAAAQSCGSLKYFSDARALESYDLLARSAFVRVLTEHGRDFEQINVLWWGGDDTNPALLQKVGPPLIVARDAIEFEARLLACAPGARAKLGGNSDVPRRARWPLRR